MNEKLVNIGSAISVNETPVTGMNASQLHYCNCRHFDMKIILMQYGPNTQHTDYISQDTTRCRH